jgi:hypothetical protein
MEQQPRQLDVSVAKTVDDANGVVLQDRPSFSSGLASDEQQRRVWTAARLVHQLPRCGRIGVMLDLDGDGSLDACEPEDCIDAAICPGRLGDHGQARDRSEDAESLSSERALDVHKFRLIHNSCEHSATVNQDATRRRMVASAPAEARTWPCPGGPGGVRAVHDRRGLLMASRLLAYNAETWLADRLNTHLRDPDEYRAITRSLMHQPAALGSPAPAPLAASAEGRREPRSSFWWRLAVSQGGWYCRHPQRCVCCSGLDGT